MKKQKTAKTYRTEEVSEYLKYIFSDAEVLELSKSLAKHNQDMSELEGEKARLTADFSAKIKKEQADIDSIARKVYSGYEFRNIKCIVKYHFPKDGLKTATRLDTGEEISELAMTASERQEILPFKEETGNGAEKKSEAEGVAV